MDLEDRLKYCKLCQNQSFKFDSGMLCGLTNEKPQFNGACPDYLENTRERKVYETNFLTERIKFKGFLDVNSYATNNRLISIATKYLPKQIEIKRFEWRNYIITPTILIAMMVIVANLKFEYSYRLVTSLGLVIVAVGVAIKNWKLLIKSATTIALIDEHGIVLKGE